MTEYFILAKNWLSATRNPTNAELVLANLMQMSKTKNSFTQREIRVVLIKRTGMSVEVLRKSIYELKKAGAITKEKGIYTLNPNITKGVLHFGGVLS